MSIRFKRRDFLKTTGVIGLGFGFLGSERILSAMAGDTDINQIAGTPNSEKLGWHLGCQAWSFNKFTLFEAIDKTASLGLKFIEACPGQKISKDHSDIQIHESLSSDIRSELKIKLNDKGVKLINYGVCTIPTKEIDARKVFDFAKDMGIETLVSEPSEDSLDMLEKLCEEYSINIALHNHPKPSHYWNPDIVLDACRGRSKRIGACADTGHWMRSGLNPVESLKKLEGRIISLHFKDLNEKGKDAHDVPWGTGVCDVKAMLIELKRQGLKAVFSIEYEYNWESSLPEIAQCVAYFEKMSNELE